MQAHSGRSQRVSGEGPTLKLKSLCSCSNAAGPLHPHPVPVKPPELSQRRAAAECQRAGWMLERRGLTPEGQLKGVASKGIFLCPQKGPVFLRRGCRGRGHPRRLSRGPRGGAPTPAPALAHLRPRPVRSGSEAKRVESAPPARKQPARSPCAQGPPGSGQGNICFSATFSFYFISFFFF